MSSKAAFIWHEALSQHVLRADHPLKAVRLQHTYELLQAYEAFDGERSFLVEPRPATEEEIRSVHEADYVQAVRSFSRGKELHDAATYGFGSGGDNPIFDGMYEAAALSTGASMMAAELVSSAAADVAFNISGGLHHAAAGHASGFCAFNDPAVAINHLLGKGLKVVYVDVDAHHGDGVQSAFYDSDRVLTISMHESGQYLFPGTGAVEETGAGGATGFSVNLPLYPYTEDGTALWAFREVVLPLVEAFKPDVLVTQLGIDSYCTDPLTHLQLTSRGYVEVVKEFAKMGLPWLAMGGGGYDLSAVARCWTLAYGIMTGRDWPDEIPVGYRERYGLKKLRDVEETQVPDNVRQDARTFAERSVHAVREIIFPAHGIK